MEKMSVSSEEKGTFVKYNLRHYCCVCSNYRGLIVDDKKVTLHRFPAGKTLRNRWLNRIPAFVSRFNEKNDRLCSVHFPNGTYSQTQKENNVPFKFILKDGRVKVFGKSSSSRRLNRACLSPAGQTEDNTKGGLKEEEDEMEVVCTYENLPFRSCDVSENGVAENVSVLFHDYGCEVPKSATTSLNKDSQTQYVHVQTLNSAIQTELSTRSFGTQIETAPREPCRCTKPVMCDIGVQVTVKKPDLAAEDISSEEMCMFYTGLPNPKCMNLLFDEMKDSEELSNSITPYYTRLTLEFEDGTSTVVPVSPVMYRKVVEENDEAVRGSSFAAD